MGQGLWLVLEVRVGLSRAEFVLGFVVKVRVMARFSIRVSIVGGV